MAKAETTNKKKEQESAGKIEFGDVVREDTDFDGAHPGEEISLQSDDDEAETIRGNRMSREDEIRKMVWGNSQILPSPDPRDDWDHKYVRITNRGEFDNVNLSQARRAGWEPVDGTEYPELHVISDKDNPFSENNGVLVGGLLLCRRDKAIGKAFEEKATQEQRTAMGMVDKEYLNDQDDRLGSKYAKNRSTITFGGGR